MRTSKRSCLAGLVLGLLTAGACLAKEAAKPLPDAEERNPIPAERIVSGQEANRFIEILIELAWLADPVTFPYFLEARIEGATLHVRGFVSSNAVRDQALKVARLQCPMTVKDDLKIRQGIGMRPARIPTGQLENAALSSLRVSFPRPDCRFQVQADAAGRVKVMGQVHSFDEKLAVSQELRRQHGCTGVINQVHVVAGEQTTATVPMLQPGMEAASALGKPIAGQSKPLPTVATVKHSPPDRKSVV